MASRSRYWGSCSPPECKHCVICSIRKAHPESHSSSCWSTRALRMAYRHIYHSRNHRRHGSFPGDTHRMQSQHTVGLQADIGRSKIHQRHGSLLMGMRHTQCRRTGYQLALRHVRRSTAHQRSIRSGIRLRSGIRGPLRTLRKTRIAKSKAHKTHPQASICIRV